MRRFLTVTAVLSLLAASGPGARPLQASKPCDEYCGEKAAENCEDLESFKCGFYILGCLAGCGITRL